MQALDFDQATAISADGSVIVGRHTNGAVHWRNGEWQYLTSGPNGQQLLHPTAVSSDGSVIVGYGDAGDGPTVAMIWDAAHGARRVDSILADGGAIGWRLHQATGVSADGRTIVGYGRNAQGNFEGWVVVVPEPSTGAIATVVILAVIIRRR